MKFVFNNLFLSASHRRDTSSRLYVLTVYPYEYVTEKLKYEHKF